MRWRRGALTAGLLCLTLVGGCGGTGGTAYDAAQPLPNGELAPWTQYHRGPARSGHVAKAPGRHLAQKWSRNLRGEVYGEPLVVGSTLIVATEQNYVYGLDARSGRTRWRSKQLGTPVRLSALPCGNIDPLGITGTPAYDAATGSVFVAAESTGGRHTLWALDARTGARRWHRNLDTQRDRSKLAEQQRSALLVTSGRVIVAFGGLAGDCDNYVGYLVSTATDGRGRSHSYAVPTSREGGIWAPPGPAAGYHGHVYVAAGNGAELGGSWDQSDSVTELTPVTLRRVAVYAPASWPADNRDDLDLGSSSPVLVRKVGRIVIAGKRGVVYLLRPGLGGVGAEVTRLGGCTAFGGAAVVGRTVLMPCRGEDAIRALRVGRSSLRWGWTSPGVYSSPVVAGRYVYVADQGSGDLVVLRLDDGRVVERHHVGEMPHFSSQIVSGRWVFVPSLQGVAAFRGRS